MLYTFDVSVSVEADDFESALAWLKAMPIEKQLDYQVIDYFEM